jgi:hypothetical protein
MRSIPFESPQAQILVNTFIRSVYNWMAIGLALTGVVAFYVSNSPSIQQLIFGNRLVFFGLIIGELALVFSLAARVNKMQASTATGLFVLYAVLNGATCHRFSWFTPRLPLQAHFLSVPPLLWRAAFLV